MIILEKNKTEKKRSMQGLRQIKASAGSGKTYELTASFLSALDKCTLNAPHHSACNLSTIKAPTLLSELLAINLHQGDGGIEHPFCYDPIHSFSSFLWFRVIPLISAPGPQNSRHAMA